MYTVPGAQDAGALVLLRRALRMMNGAYYLNANKYRATNWLHFSSFPCCRWWLSDARSSRRHITVLISSDFFVLSLQWGNMDVLPRGIFAASSAWLHREQGDTACCEMAELHISAGRGLPSVLSRAGKFVVLAELCRALQRGDVP